MDDIRDNLLRVRERIARACSRCGRPEDDVTLVCVSKTIPVERVRQAVVAGATDLGENYVQEAAPKIEDIGKSVRWHLIGHLQRNKARKALEMFHLIQSVDSIALARRLSDLASKAGKVAEVLVEVNVGGEESKTGAEAETARGLIQEVCSLPSLRLLGAMGIPPLSSDEVALRNHFRSLRSLWEDLPEQNRKVLSIGMSGDFEIAVEEGSTMVRVGTAVFGPRAG